MTEFYSTRQAASKLGIRPDQLMRAVWLNKVTPPKKSPSGAFLWTDSDIESASWAMHLRNRMGANHGK